MKEVLRRVLPAVLWGKLSAIKALLTRGFQRSMEAMGFTVAQIDDYYSPLPSVRRLEKTSARWFRPSELRGIEYDLEAMKENLQHLVLRYADEFATLPPYELLRSAGYGPGYTEIDALTLYGMIREHKPRRYLEVGSGLSTCYSNMAGAKNKSEGSPLSITCIEPYPYEKLYTLPGVRVLASEVQDTEIALFEELEANDVLFVDSTHILRIDGDVAFVVLEALPTLKAGVLVHFHDIPFPYNCPYPPQLWMTGRTWPAFWNEAMVLQAFLCFNQRFEIALSTPLIRHFDESFLKRNLPGYRSLEQEPNTFSSIWLKRVS